MVNGFDFISIAIFAFYFIYRLIYWFFFVRCAHNMWIAYQLNQFFYQFRMLFDCFMVFSLSLSFDKMGESVSVLWLQNMNGSGSI